MDMKRVKMSHAGFDNFPQRLKYFNNVKVIVHFEINFWHVLAYLKGIQDVGVFASTVFSILIFLGQTVKQ